METPTEKDAETPLCKTEKFLDEYRIANCTGVLVAPDIVLTAAHCVERDSATDTAKPWETRVVTDLTHKAGDPPPDFIPYSRVHEVEWTTAIRSTRGAYALAGEDIGVIKLKIGVEKDRVVSVRSAADKLGSSAMVYALGHPNGLPMKVSPNGKVVAISESVPKVTRPVPTGG